MNILTVSNWSNENVKIGPCLFTSYGIIASGFALRTYPPMPPIWA